jgi:hypothetical protein
MRAPGGPRILHATSPPGRDQEQRVLEEHRLCNHHLLLPICRREGVGPVSPAPRVVRRRRLFIIPSGQGRPSPARSKAFHRTRYACDFGRPFREGRVALSPGS